MVALEQVLVATDFGEAADVALAYGRELARHLGASLHLFHAVDDVAGRALVLSAGTATNLGLTQTLIEDEARRRIEALLSEEDRRELRATTHVATSNSPATAIVSHAKALKVGLIVVGTHGRGPMTHLLLGNVAERVVRTASCPVLTVRHPEREFVLPDALQTTRRA